MMLLLSSPSMCIWQPWNVIWEDSSYTCRNFLITYLVNSLHNLYCAESEHWSNIVLEINLQYSTKLAHLQIMPQSEFVNSGARWETATKWIISLLSTVATESLYIHLRRCPSDLQGCEKIEDALLNLTTSGRVYNLRVYLGNKRDEECGDKRKDWLRLFPRLYEKGIWTDEFCRWRD